MRPDLSDTRVRGALAVCVLALVACVVVSLGRSSPSEAEAVGPVRAMVPDRASCLVSAASGAYTSGRTLLATTSDSPVEITAVRLEGAVDVTIDQAYAVPAADGSTLGDASQWPPSKDLVRGAPGWLSRVRAVGPDRLGPIGDQTDPDSPALWNLVLHLTASGPTPSYDAVTVDYRADGTDWSTTTDRGLEVTTSPCS